MLARFAAVLLPFVSIAAACGGGDATVSSVTVASGPESTTASTVTSGPESTTASTVIEESRSTISPGEPDWLAIVQGLSAVLDELQAEPDANRIDEFCASRDPRIDGAGFGCHDVQGAAIRQYDEAGWRTIDFPQSVVTLAERKNPEGGEASLVQLLVDEAPQDFSATHVVDESGDVVFPLRTDEGKQRAFWLLDLDDDGRWRVVGIDSITLTPAGPSVPAPEDCVYYASARRVFCAMVDPAP